jgi:site-specific DNA-methyltransferase (adenine-specific)
MSLSNLTLINRLDREFPLNHTSKYEVAVNFRQSSTHAVHRWFRYREGFSPTILDTVAGATRIYDPFSGCGTSLIEAKRRGVNAVGTDVNPLAVFIAHVKTQDYSQRDIKEFKKAADLVVSYDDAGRWPEPPMPLLPKLFQPAALNELLRIRAKIEHCRRPRVKELLFLSWLSILERCSNVFKEGNGLKYRNKRRRPGAYETIPDEVWVPRYFGPSIKNFVRHAWIEQCEMVFGDLVRLGNNDARSEIFEMSCLDDDVVERAGACDASVFSPPYANRFDYFESFKLELWMGGFVKSPADMQSFRQRSMRNNLTVADGRMRKWRPLEPFLEMMDKDSSSVQMGIQNTLRGYFDDMSLLARNMSRILRPGGKLACVVGNSAYAGVVVPTDVLCARVFEEEGLRVESVSVARHLTVSSQQRAKVSPTLLKYMRESVIECSR